MQTPTEKLIKFVKAKINTAQYGACCFGVVRRRTGDDLLAIYWPYLDNVNPEIAALWEVAEALVDNETREQIAGRAMRQRFCLPNDWANYVRQRQKDQTLAPPPWEGPQRNCHFYPLAAFGLTWDDFALYRAKPRPLKSVEVKPWVPLAHRQGDRRQANVLMPIMLSPTEVAMLASQYPDTPIPTILWELVDAAMTTTDDRAALIIPGISHKHTFVPGQRQRFNIYLPIAIDDLLRDYANANQVPISAIIRSIIHGNPHWKCQQVLDKVS